MNFFACSVCYGDPQSLLSRGAVAGVWFMIVVVSLLLFAVSLTAFCWLRRAKQKQIIF